jgi:hypothetical protein
MSEATEGETALPMTEKILGVAMKATSHRSGIGMQVVRLNVVSPTNHDLFLLPPAGKLLPGGSHK